jgi:hypothetical protein
MNFSDLHMLTHIQKIVLFDKASNQHPSKKFSGARKSGIF